MRPCQSQDRRGVKLPPVRRDQPAGGQPAAHHDMAALCHDLMDALGLGVEPVRHQHLARPGRDTGPGSPPRRRAVSSSASKRRAARSNAACRRNMALPPGPATPIPVPSTSRTRQPPGTATPAPSAASSWDRQLAHQPAQPAFRPLQPVEQRHVGEIRHPGRSRPGHRAAQAQLGPAIDQGQAQQHARIRHPAPPPQCPAIARRALQIDQIPQPRQQARPRHPGRTQHRRSLLSQAIPARRDNRSSRVTPQSLS